MVEVRHSLSLLLHKTEAGTLIMSFHHPSPPTCIVQLDPGSREVLGELGFVQWGKDRKEESKSSYMVILQYMVIFATLVSFRYSSG